MTANPSFTTKLRGRFAAALIESLQRLALSLAALVVVAGSALHAPTVAAPRPKSERAAVTVDSVAQPQDDQDDQGGDDEQEAEGPMLEQIPVVPASEPQSLAVSRRSAGAAVPVARRL